MDTPTQLITSFRGYDLAETRKGGSLRHCDVWKDDEFVRAFHGEDALDKAKQWILRRLADAKYPRISMRSASRGR